MDIESFNITDGSTKDLNVLDGDFINKIKGWLVGDKGYIGQKKTKELSNRGIKLLTRPMFFLLIVSSYFFKYSEKVLKIHTFSEYLIS